ncbi:type IV pilus assembly protein FimV [Roseateles sp. DB2]
MPSAALNVGAPQTHSALFQPLRLVFPLQLLPGEGLSPDCVKAVLVAGETRLPADQVQVQLLGRTEGEINAVRVSSLIPIDEPLVSVSLSLGCPTRYTRQFTALIDPQPSGMRSEPPAMLEGDELYSPALRAALATPGSKAGDLLAPGRAVPAQGAAQAPTQIPTQVPTQAPTASSASQPEASLKKSTSTRGAAKQAGKSRAVPAAEAHASASSAPLGGKAPRLQLEAPEVLAAASSEPSPSAVLESQQQVKQLEVELARVRAEAKEVQDTLKQLSAQLRHPQGVDRSWLLMLAGISLLLAVACAWLFMQLQSLRRATHEAWWAHVPEAGSTRAGDSKAPSAAAMALAAEAGPTPTAHDTTAALHAQPEPAEDAVGRDFLNSELPPIQEDTAATPFARTAPVSAEDAEAVSLQLLDMPQANTDLQPLQTLPERSAVDGVSVEELIDLEQQVDFFMVLGQQEAAVELLSQRLHEKGRHTALPHLKLMEILQRHGDQTGFERVANEFSERFHAQAPVWNDDIAAGEGLLAYAQATELIVQSWRDAAMTMQLIQTLLAHGDPDGRAFDLPAYRDILMLYAVARDISEHEVRGEDIDLFLPLDASRQGSPTSMMATMPFQRRGAPSPVAGPVDLDLDLSKGGIKG